MSDATALLEGLIAEKDAQLKIVTKAFRDGNLDSDEKSFFDKCVLDEFKTKKTALITELSNGNLLTSSSSSASASPRSSSFRPEERRSKKSAGPSRPNKSARSSTTTKLLKKSTSSSFDDTRERDYSSEHSKKRSSSHDDEYPQSPSMKSVETPSPVDPSKRRRYPTNHFNPYCPGTIKDTAEYAISDKLRKETAIIAEAESKLPRKWKQTYGFGEHIGRTVYLNPYGRRYLPKCDPVLGEDFFLDPRDALAYIDKLNQAAAASFAAESLADDKVKQDPEEQDVERASLPPAGYSSSSSSSSSSGQQQQQQQQRDLFDTDCEGGDDNDEDECEEKAKEAPVEEKVEEERKEDILSLFRAVGSNAAVKSAAAGPSSSVSDVQVHFRQNWSAGGGGFEEEKKEHEGYPDQAQRLTGYAHPGQSSAAITTTVAAKSLPSSSSSSSSSSFAHSASTPSTVQQQHQHGQHDNHRHQPQQQHLQLESAVASPISRPNSAIAAPRPSAKGMSQVPDLEQPQVAIKLEPLEDGSACYQQYGNGNGHGSGHIQM